MSDPMTTEPTTTPAARRTLVDVLAEAWASPFKPESFDPGLAQELIAGMDPADREALEVGLQLAALDKEWPWLAVIRLMPRTQETTITARWGDQAVVNSSGPTLHAALTALLANLEETK